MATLYVENIPDELYKALREHAHRNRKSIAAEILRLIEENIPTASELKRRQQFLKKVQQLHANAGKPAYDGKPLTRRFPSAEEMVREDRER
jgi:plasmid stability protein